MTILDLMSARYAVYFAPDPASALWRFGTRWLGRDPISGTDLAQPRLPGIDQARLRQVTESPRHYGFHATLKAPFELSPGATRADLDDALRRFAAGRPAFELAPLRAAALGGFLALLTSQEEPALQKLADASVREFDRFRAPPPPQEIARRRTGSLTDRQRGYLDAWGYPFVFDAFRFHMTLTCRLDAREGGRFLEELQPLTEELNGDRVAVDAICLFEQPNRGAPFRLTGRYILG